MLDLGPHPAAEAGDVASGEMKSQRSELGDEITMPTGRVGLALERAQLAPHFAQQVSVPKGRVLAKKIGHFHG